MSSSVTSRVVRSAIAASIAGRWSGPRGTTGRVDSAAPRPAACGTCPPVARAPLLRRLVSLLAAAVVLGPIGLGAAPPVAATTPGLPALPTGWPLADLALGLADGPGGAASLQSVAPFQLRYQYLAGGVNTGGGWQTWNTNGTFVSMYVSESAAHDIVPVFSYYMLRQSKPGNAQGEYDGRPGQPQEHGHDDRLLEGHAGLHAACRGGHPGRPPGRTGHVGLRRAVHRHEGRCDAGAGAGLDHRARRAGRPAQQPGRLRPGGGPPA